MIGFLKRQLLKTIESVNKYRQRKRWKHLRKKGMYLGEGINLPMSTWIDESHCFLIHIGDNSGFGPDCAILAHDAMPNEYLDATKVGRVTIHESCHIGMRTIILPGVEIGPRTIIGSNSVVTKSIPPDTVASGNPAKVICSLEEYLDKHRNSIKQAPLFPFKQYSQQYLDEKRMSEMTSKLNGECGYVTGGYTALVEDGEGVLRTDNPILDNYSSRQVVKSRLLNIVDRFNLFPFFNIFTKNTATVFMLHRINPDGGNKENRTTPAILRKYFDYIKQNGYKVISLGSYIEILTENKDTYKTVIFTVDDGYRDFYQNAYPVFKEYGYPASIFITSDFVDGKLFMWWDRIWHAIITTDKKELSLSSVNGGIYPLITELQKYEAISKIVDYCKKITNKSKLKIIDELISKLDVENHPKPPVQYEPLNWEEIGEMSRNGIDFFPHTKTHPIMTRIPHDEKIKELSESKKLIEEKLNINANIFCYPNGGPDDFDDETILALKSTSYIAAVTGSPGFNYTKENTDRYLIARYGLPNEPEIFKQHLSGLERFKLKYLYRNST